MSSNIASRKDAIYCLNVAKLTTAYQTQRRPIWRICFCVVKQQRKLLLSWNHLVVFLVKSGIDWHHDLNRHSHERACKRSYFCPGCFILIQPYFQTQNKLIFQNIYQQFTLNITKRVYVIMILRKLVVY
jgi:hypothetical protein